MGFSNICWASFVAQLVKESGCNAGGLESIPGLGRVPGGGKGFPLQYSGLENSMDCVVHGVTKSQTRLSNFHFTSLHFIGLLSRFMQTIQYSFYNEEDTHNFHTYQPPPILTNRLGCLCKL